MARRPHQLDMDIVLLGLLYAAHIGAVVVASSRLELRNAAPLLAARLFAALQLKLRREELRPAAAERLEMLLPRLPSCWQSALRGRVAQRTREQSAEAATSERMAGGSAQRWPWSAWAKAAHV